MQKLKLFFESSYDEMKNKVTWPKSKELRKSSSLVLIASLIFAVLIGLVDIMFKEGMDFLYNDAF